MIDEAEKKVLHATLAHMLKPVRNVSFAVVIKTIYSHEVKLLDRDLAADQVLLTELNSAIQLCAVELTKSPIHRPRPNEVGNNVEAYVMRVLPTAGLRAFRPTSKLGMNGSVHGLP